MIQTAFTTTLGISKHTIKTLFDIIIGVLVVLVCLIGFTLWSLSSGPVNVSWVKPYLQSAITDGNKNMRLDVGSIVAEWPKFSGPLSLGVSNFQLFEGTRKLIDVDRVGIRLSKSALLIGQISPEAMIITGPSIKIIRNQTGNVHLSFAGGQDVAETTIETPTLSIKDVGNALFLSKHLLPVAGFGAWGDLAAFVLNDVHILGEDHVSGVTWVMTDVDMTLTRTRKTFDLRVSLPHATDVKKSSTLRLTAQKKNDKTVNFSTIISSFDMSLFSKMLSQLSVFSSENYILNGTITGTLDHDWMIKNLNGSIGADTMQDKVFSIAAKRNGNFLPVILSLKSATMAQIAALWPKGLEDYSITEWMTKRLSKGTINNIAVSLPFVHQGIMKEWGLQNPRATFDFVEMDVNYQEPIAPVKNSNGRGSIENDTLKINIGSGNIGGMALRGGMVQVTNLTNPDPTMIIIKANVQSKLSDILNYIYAEPINLDDTLTLDPKLVKGMADAVVDVTLPGQRDVKIEDVDVKVTGTLTNAVLPNIVKNVTISGGPYEVNVADGEFRFKGTGQVGGRVATLDYKEFLDHDTAPYIADLTAKIDTDANLRKEFGVNLDMFIDGNVPADIRYKQEKNKSSIIDISANVTGARVMLDALRFEKPKGQSGFVTARAILEGDAVKKIENLTMTMGKDSAKGDIVFGNVGGVNDVQSGIFPIVKLGGHDIVVKFSQKSTNNFAADVTGATLDFRPFLKGKSNDTGNNTASNINATITVQTKTLRGGDAPDQILKNPNIKLNIDGRGDIRLLNLTGNVMNGAPVSVSMKPNSQNQMMLSVNTKNAGAFLYALGIYDKMRGGDMNISATQITGRGVNDFRGVGELKNFKIVKAPVLAKLVNAFSLSGIAALLSNDGIEFNRLRTDFDWRDTRDGRVINLRNGKTSGASIGLTFGGVLNQDTNRTDLSGTVVPVAGVNKIVSQIPLVGELLTGGKDGGIIAATYALKGPSDNPSVIINPLSVLAPGFLRSILFENDNANTAPAARQKPKSTKANKQNYN